MFNKIKTFFAKTETVVKPETDAENSVAFISSDSIMNGISMDSVTLDQYEKMSYDDQVNACLATRVQAMFAKGYQITASSQEKTDIDLATEIKNVLDNMAGSFKANLKAIERNKKKFGFSITEIIWAVNNGKYVISALKTRNSQKFKFYPDKFGNLLPDSLRQVQDSEVPIPAEKFIIHVNEFDNSNWFGTSELKYSYLKWLTKDKVFNLYTQLLERFGIPPIIVVYKKDDFTGLTPEERQSKIREEARLIRKTHQGGVIMMPDTYAHEVMLLNPASSTAFENCLAMLDKGISRGLKVPDEIGFTNTSVGSQAKAQTQFDVFLWIVEQDQEELEEVINEQLIKRYVQYNYGIQDTYPKIKFNPITEDDKYTIIKTYNDALRAGSVRPTTDGENKTLELLDYPEINEENIIETTPQPDLNNPAPQKFSKKKEYNGIELNQYEEKVNFSKIDDFLLTKENQVIADIKDVIDALYVDISNKIVNKKIIPEQKIDEINKLSFKGSLIGDIKRVLQKALKQTGEEGKTQLQNELNQIQKFAISSNEILPPQYTEWITGLSQQIAGEIAGKYLEETKKVLLASIQKGVSEKKTIQMLEEAYTTKQLSEGAYPAVYPEARLQVIARTNLNASFNKSRYMEVLQLNDETKDVYYKQFSEILDGRNHPFSLFIHGKSVKVGSALDQQLQMPLHYNDRGICVYINATYEGEPSDILTTMPNLQGYSGMLI